MKTSNESFAIAYLIYTLIRGINFSVEKDIKKSLNKYNMSFPSFRILWVLYFDPSISMSKLAMLIQTNISNVYRQLVKLEEEGYVRLKSGKDSRMKEITVNESGREVVSTYLRENSQETDIKLITKLESIPMADLQQLIQIISQISTKITGEFFTDFILQTADAIKTNENIYLTKEEH